MSGTVGKAAEILMALAEAGRDVSAREIGALTNVPKSTALRLLQSLEESGLVDQDQESRRYRLGARTLTLGMAYLARTDVRMLARPYMLELRDLLDETIALAVRSGSSRVYVEQMESRAVLKAKAEIGRLYPLWAGSSGRVLLASLSEDELIRFTHEVGEEAAFTHVTPHTFPGFLARIEVTRTRGYDWAFDESISGVHTIAAPIRVSFTEVVALSVSGPSTRFSQPLMEEATSPLLEAARAISAAIGHAETGNRSAKTRRGSLKPLKSRSGE